MNIDTDVNIRHRHRHRTDVDIFQGHFKKTKSVESSKILSIKGKRCSVGPRVNGQRTFQWITEVVPSSGDALLLMVDKVKKPFAIKFDIVA